MIEFRAEHFSLDFENEKKWYPAVTDFNMHIDAGEMVALIGAVSYTHLTLPTKLEV